MTEQHSQFSENAYHNIDVLFNITDKAILTTGKVFKEKNLELIIDIWALRDLSELYREIFKNDHIQRLKDGKCNVESGIAFLELLSIFEKIMNYCLNISIATSNYMTNKKFVTEQDFRKELYETKTDILKDKLNEYSYTYSI